MFSVKGEEGKQALDRWISWARRCRIPVFVELAGGIVRHRQAIDAALDHGLWQGLIESTNTKIRLLTRIAFGFRSPEALIALAMLALGGRRPALPGRTKHPRISQYSRKTWDFAARWTVQCASVHESLEDLGISPGLSWLIGP